MAERLRPSRSRPCAAPSRRPPGGSGRSRISGPLNWAARRSPVAGSPSVTACGRRPPEFVPRRWLHPPSRGRRRRVDAAEPTGFERRRPATPSACGTRRESGGGQGRQPSLPRAGRRGGWAGWSAAEGSLSCSTRERFHGFLCSAQRVPFMLRLSSVVAAGDPADLVMQVEHHAGVVEVPPESATTVVGALAPAAGAPGHAMGRPDISHQAGRVELDADHGGRFQPDESSE